MKTLLIVYHTGGVKTAKMAEERVVRARFGAVSSASASQWLMLAAAKSPYKQSYGK